MGHRPSYLHRHRGDHRSRRYLPRIPIPEPLNPTLIMKEQFIHIDEDGHKCYYSDREMKISHREDGPAIEDADGYKAWFINGKRHREDGPAIEYIDGSKSWYINGKLHREDGPAVEYADAHKAWYINGNSIVRMVLLSCIQMEINRGTSTVNATVRMVLPSSMRMEINRGTSMVNVSLKKSSTLV
jgi:hypothetical protein